MRFKQPGFFILLFMLMSLPVLVPLSAVAQKSHSPNAEHSGNQALLISEFMASNENSLADEDGDGSDWIEIYNPNEVEVDLNDWYLTDDAQNLKKWRFPQVTLAGDSYLVLFASGKDRRVASRELHTNFKLDRGGEYLALLKPDGQTVVAAFAPSYPPQALDLSYGYPHQSSTAAYFESPTPRTQNQSTGLAGYLDKAVEFSVAGGFYASSFRVALSYPEQEVDIRYTTDGSEPSLLSLTYRAPIAVGDSQSVRARAFKGGYFHSEISSQSYIFNNDSPLPVIHIATDPDNLWHDERGMYVIGVNGTTRHCPTTPKNWYQDWEYPAHITLFEPDGSLGFSAHAGISITGGCSREHEQKSFNISFRSEYGTPELDYQLFPSKAQTQFKGFKLRNSGNDWEHTMLQDAAVQSLLEGMVDIDMQSYRPATVYLNGVHWGIYNIRDRLNRHYVGHKFPGIDSDQLDIIWNPAQVRKAHIVQEIREGDDVHFQDLYEFMATHDLSDAIHYQYVADRIDINEYLNYVVANIYIANYDWPGNNVKIWRPRTPDGKWRWMMFDLDLAANGHGTARPWSNTLAIVTDGNSTTWPNKQETTLILRKMLENETFRNEYIQRTATFGELIYEPNRVNRMITAHQDAIVPQLTAHIGRWPESASGSVANWQDKVNGIKDFFQQRPSYLRDHIKSYFNIAGTYHLTINAAREQGGQVLIHESQMALPDHYRGRYFEDVPIKLLAVPEMGYRFSHWQETGETSDRIYFTDNRDATLTPIFTPDALLADLSNLIISEIHYHPDDTDDFEFLEFKNISDQTIDLSSVVISGGLDFTFPTGSSLAAGAHLLVVEQEASFMARYMAAGSAWFYDGITVAGEWSGKLSNSGENMTITAADGAQIMSFGYSDTGAWPGRADGKGSSSELTAPEQVPTSDLAAKNAYLADGESWRASSAYHGSPGRDGNGPDNRVVINEALAHSTPPLTDAIELHNTTGSEINISGWFLSDDADEYQRYQIPANTTVDAGGFVDYDEDDFNDASNPNNLVPFALSSTKGDDVYLLEADSSGNLLRFVDHVEFGASRADESFGRWPDGTGDLYPMRTRTLGASNASNGNQVRVGSVVISEIHYNPAGSDDNLEYIELHNSGNISENLANWRLRGEVDYDFTAQQTLAAGETVLLVGFDPTDSALSPAFLAQYDIDNGPQLIGPWHDNGTLGVKLDNGGASLKLQRPAELVTPSDGTSPFYPMLSEDTVTYDDNPPWPEAADGNGPSLQRVDLTIYGDEASNWQASTRSGGTPGLIVLPAPSGSASLSGMIWQDVDADGTEESGERGLVGTMIHVIEAGADQVLQTADDRLYYLSQPTDSDGQYAFTSLPAGLYRLEIEQNSVPQGLALTTGNQPLMIRLATGQQVTQLNVGYAPLICQRTTLYGVHNAGKSNSQLFTLDLASNELAPLGPIEASAINGLDIHPTTGELYALRNGQLIKIDRETGSSTPINSTANAITSASFAADGTLWVFQQNVGLLNIDLSTANSTLIWKHSATTWDGLAWTADGTSLYATAGRNLYRWDASKQVVSQLCGNDFLPASSMALDMRFDGQLIAAAQDATRNALSLYQLSPASCSITPISYHTTYNNPQAIAVDSCLSSGTLAVQVVADEDVDESVAGLRLRLEIDHNGDGTYSSTTYAVTDENGRYTFTNLPSGSYRLSLVHTLDRLEVELTVDNLQREVEIMFTGSLPRLFLPILMR